MAGDDVATDPTSVAADINAVPPIPSPRKPVYGGIYVDDFVFYCVDPEEENIQK